MQVSLSQQVLLHREEGGGGGRGDAELVVDVLEVMARGLHRDLERRGNLFVGEPAGHEAQDLELAVAEAARSRGLRARLVSGPRQDGFYRVAVEASASSLFA